MNISPGEMFKNRNFLPQRVFKITWATPGTSKIQLTSDPIVNCVFSLIVDLAKFMTVLSLFLIGFTMLITALNTPFYSLTDVSTSVEGLYSRNGMPHSQRYYLNFIDYVEEIVVFLTNVDTCVCLHSPKTAVHFISFGQVFFGHF